jgi:hypothetical protein
VVKTSIKALVLLNLHPTINGIEPGYFYPMKLKTVIAACVFGLFGCTDTDQIFENDVVEQRMDTTNVLAVSKEALNSMTQTLPSLIEIANIITKSTKDLDKDLLIPFSNTKKFPDKYSQALALGAYGVDLSYLNLKNNMPNVVQCLENLNAVSKELNVNQFLDFSVLNDLTGNPNNNNLDSLIRVSTANFININEYFRSQKRGDLSVLILVGSWLEGLHMFNQIAKESPSENIERRIGEQKIIVDGVYKILSQIETIDYYKELKEKLQPLKSIYANVKITYVYQEPKIAAVNGEWVIIDNSQCFVEITKAELAAIDRETKSLRADVFDMPDLTAEVATK